MVEPIDIPTKLNEVNRLKRAGTTGGGGDIGGEPPDNGDMTEAVPRPELDAKLATVRADTLAAGAELRADFAGLRAEFSELRGEMRTGFEAVRGEIHKSTADTIKWVVGVTISVVAVAVAILTSVIHNAAKAPAMQSAPIIINVPPAAPAPAAPAK